ncbi:hypothetical protein [Celeribacter litoreus]|uniref:hypothetical protein n=1 Tax=Celeribacter litoreus TaxID=2876714 RepID=UPI001CCD9253|nr:hypothetical protein [Celeribacter litoreus]MCA0044222.1 hypothetical protein [Celeribacter litoreus]
MNGYRKIGSSLSPLARSGEARSEKSSFGSRTHSRSLLSLVIGLQAVLLLTIFGGFARLIYLQRDSTLVLVIFTPGIFAILWSIDPISSLRKEMIGLAILIWLALPGGSLQRIIISGALMLLGGIAQEINILMIPAWIIALWLFQPTSLSHPVAKSMIAVVLVAGAAEAVYALKYSSLADASPICAALMEKGLSGTPLCSGAIAWLSNPENGPETVLSALERSWTAWLLPGAWLVAIAPILRLLQTQTSARRKTGWLLLVAATPIVLLYPVGLDWGRWFAVQVTITATLLLGLGVRGQLSETHAISRREKTLWLISCLLWGFMHDPILTNQGLLMTIAG